jgi:putative transposase
VVDVAGPTIAGILSAEGISPVPDRPTSWRTFLRAHWGAIVGADFFTTEVWTWRGLVTSYTVFVMDLASRQVRLVGSTPHPDDLFMDQVGRALIVADEGVLVGQRILICARDAKWSALARQRPNESGIRVVQGLENARIEDRRPPEAGGAIRRRPRLGGLLNYYCRAA